MVYKVLCSGRTWAHSNTKPVEGGRGSSFIKCRDRNSTNFQRDFVPWTSQCHQNHISVGRFYKLQTIRVITDSILNTDVDEDLEDSTRMQASVTKFDYTLEKRQKKLFQRALKLWHAVSFHFPSFFCDVAL